MIRATVPLLLGEIAADATVVDVGSVRIRVRCVRDLAPFIDVPTQLAVGDAPEPPYWMHLWPAARVVARMIVTSSRVGPGMLLLELGCGLALPALAAAARGAAVIATDWQLEPLRFARASAADNGVALGVAQMDWGALSVQRRFDVCVGADIGYAPGGAAALVRALSAALKPGGVAWLADSVNTHRDELPSALRNAGFTVDISTTAEPEDGRPVWVRVIDAHAPHR